MHIKRGAMALTILFCLRVEMAPAEEPEDPSRGISREMTGSNTDSAHDSGKDSPRSEDSHESIQEAPANVYSYNEKPCELKGPADVVRCALGNDPSILQARLEFRESQAALDVADNVPNPRLEGNYMFGQRSAELQYRHIIELGDRRQLRTDAAQSSVRKAALEWEITRQNTVLTTVMMLYRLEHIQEEQEYLEETIAAFNGAIYRLYRLPSRDANQNTSLFTYMMARDSLKQQKLELLDRRNRIRQSLELSTGRDLSDSDLRRIAAGHPERWPDLPEEFQNSLEMARADQVVARATYEYRLESNRHWPDISIGPRFTVQEQPAGGLFSGTETQSNLGVSLSITLPLYNQYSAQKDQAKARKKNSEIHRTVTRTSIEREYAYLVRSYRQHVQGLKSNPSMGSLEGRRYAVLGYMRRGLLSPALLVEFHRSYGEHVHQYHAAQLRALGMLWRGYALSGRILEDEIINSIK